MIRVLYLSSSLKVGGIETNLLDLARALDPARVEPLFGYLEEEGWTGERLREEGFRVLDTGFAGVGFLSPRTPGVVRRLGRTIREEGVELIHAYNFAPSLLAVLAARGTGVPVVASRVQLPEWRGWLHRFGAALVSRRARLVAYNARALLEASPDARGVPGDRLRVLHNPVAPPEPAEAGAADALRERLEIAPEHRVVGMLANLRAVKRPGLFVEVAARLLGAGVEDVTFVLVGEGPLRPRLEERIRKAGAGGRIRLAGRVAPAGPALELMDVFLLTSRAEGCPTSVMEAMARGLPVVAVRVGGLPELVREGENGFLVEPDASDLPDALAARVRELLDEGELRGRMGRASRRIMEADFALDRVVERTYELYREALERPTDRED